ncbi:SOS response-associated peptidase [Chitinimonas sp. BJYL2]|uniref:SOS response-associated peptidase n=1 Tax=Chitinimonas sp. BJYL2 TaxID=2976696 RepID=UPI0022B3C23D|nr:SOS response-associated peptidase family protein [Chitinimonas sp. BJYL2]
MCTNYRPTRSDHLQAIADGLIAPDSYPDETYPGYIAPIVRVPHGESKGRDVLLGRFGLIPPLAKDDSFGKKTYKARTETVAEKPSYLSAWKRRQFCLVPMQGFYEPNWETGKAVRWQIRRQDEADFCVAGIWEQWTHPERGSEFSFSLLTINADGHPIMGHFHRPGDEKRSLMIVPPSEYDAWLQADTEMARTFLSLAPLAEFTSFADQKPKKGETESLFA